MRVVFRAWKGGGEMFALFPEWAGGPGGLTCVSVDRHGHSAADYAHCIQNSRPAKPEEVEGIWGFLAPLGYRREEAEPRARTPHSTHRQRMEAVRWS